MRHAMHEDLTGFVGRLRRLADDLERISEGSGPGAADLAVAPLLTAWTPIIVPVTEHALTGVVRGHPLITNGHHTVTSAIIAIDPALGWVRTWNRYYRLGAPAEGLEGTGHA